MRTIDIRKLANAFLPHATPSHMLPAGARWAIDRFRRRHGGVWVGGTVAVSPGGISFSPNRLNRSLHEGLAPINVLASEIRAVRYEFGWITGIVVVEHAHGEFRFRCYGARRLGATLAERLQVRHQRAGLIQLRPPSRSARRRP